MAFEPLEQVFELAEDGDFDAAIAAVDDMLAIDQSHARLHALRAFLLIESARPTEASISVKRAMAIDDNDAYVLHAAAEVALAMREPAEAIAAARRAHEIDPTDDQSVLIEARARMHLGQWDDVIARLDYVLAGDPQNESAAVLRAFAQESKRGLRGPMGVADWEDVSKRFPVNSFARTGFAWTLLGRGKSRDAREQFRQALTVDPGSEWAKAGMALALKAKYPGYGLLLRFFFWMGSLPQRTNTMIAIGGVIGYNMLRRVSRENPEVAPFVVPILIAYALFILATWLADPLLNLVLSMHPEGRTVLSADDRRSGRLVGACVGAAVLLAVIAALTPWEQGYIAALVMALTSMTVAGAYSCAPGRYRDRLLTTAGVLGTAGVSAAVFPLPLRGVAGGVAIVGLIVSLWVARSWAARSHE